MQKCFFTSFPQNIYFVSSSHLVVTTRHLSCSLRYYSNPAIILSGFHKTSKCSYKKVNLFPQDIISFLQDTMSFPHDTHLVPSVPFRSLKLCGFLGNPIVFLQKTTCMSFPKDITNCINISS